LSAIPHHEVTSEGMAGIESFNESLDDMVEEAHLVSS